MECQEISFISKEILTKQAISEKHKHLVVQLDSSDNEAMMEVLNKEFGTKDLVLWDIVSQIQKVRVVNADRTVIDLAEELQKIKLDIE